MQAVVSVMWVRYPDIYVPQWQGRKLRGFFASGQENDLLHNHTQQGGELYRYPLVQYKIVDGIPVVVAVGDGIPALQPLVVSRQELVLGNRTYPRGQLFMELEDELLGDTEERFIYRFVTPWFGLNQENHRRYVQSGPEERKTLLERVLTGNLLSLAKGLGVTVDRRLLVAAALEEESVPFKNETVLGFTGGFSVNFRIPCLLGLGKSVSRGFGAVRMELDR